MPLHRQRSVGLSAVQRERETAGLRVEIARVGVLAEHLHALASRLSAAADSDSLLEVILAEVCAIGYAGGALLPAETVSEEGFLRGQRVLFAGAETWPTCRFLPGLPDVGRLLCDESGRTSRPGVETDYGPDINASLQQYDIREQAALPIRYRGQRQGVLVVWASPAQTGRLANGDAPPLLPGGDCRQCERAADPFDDVAIHFLATLADQAAVALGNLRLQEEMRVANACLDAQRREAAGQAEQLAAANDQLLAAQNVLESQYHTILAANAELAALATTDGMTRLSNHRAFQEELARQVARAERSRAPISLLLLDVDKFKQYNDTFGHPAGDDVLKGVARLLQATVREGDFPARYGGEEFAVLLPDTPADIAVQVAERVRQTVEEQPFPNRAVTVSVGVAQHLPGELPHAFLQRADVALYEAKSAGRNCVMTLLAELPQEEAIALDAGEPEKEGAGEKADHVLIPLTLVEAHSHSSVAPPLPMLLDGGLEGMLQEPAAQVLNELIALCDRRDVAALGHSERLARYSLRLGSALIMLYDDLRPTRPLLPRLTLTDMVNLAFGALLHDIGKLGIPELIIRKSGKLGDDEWRQMRRHPLVGAELVQGFPLLARALPVVRFHHERWDGSGYPQGLAGEAIPLTARIFAVCDTFEVLTTDMPWRPRWEYAAACEEIVSVSGTQFDPDVVAAFLRVPEADWQHLHEQPTLLPALAETLIRAA